MGNGGGSGSRGDGSYHQLSVEGIVVSYVIYRVSTTVPAQGWEGLRCDRIRPNK